MEREKEGRENSRFLWVKQADMKSEQEKTERMSVLSFRRDFLMFVEHFCSKTQRISVVASL